MNEGKEGKMIPKEKEGKLRFHLFLVLGIAFLFSLSSPGCGKKSDEGIKTTEPTKFLNPDDAASKTFGNFTAGPVSNILTGRITTGSIITARIISGQIITARAPRLIPYHHEENDILNLFSRLKTTGLSKKQSEEFKLSCEDLKPQCIEGKIDSQVCSIDQAKGRLTFDIKVSDCKEVIDESQGNYIVSTGYAKGYVEASTKVLSSESFEAKLIFVINDGESLVKEFRDNKEVKRVKTKASGYKAEFTGEFILGDREIKMNTGIKLSGSYSIDDDIGKKKERYSYSDFVVHLLWIFPKSEGGYPLDLTNLQIYLSIDGKYSVDTEPQSCIEGVFNFKTLKPLKAEILIGQEQSHCGAESGEIEVNNAKIEFSPDKVKVVVGEQQKEYSCEEIAGLCKYEPITIAEEFKKGETQPQLSSEAQQALDKISKISPDDSLQDIIAQYKEARKIMLQKMMVSPLTPEEKYIYFIADSAILVHQLIDAVNKFSSAALSGKLVDPQTVIDILNSISQAPPQKRIYPSQTVSQEKITNIPYGCDIPGITGLLCVAINDLIFSRLERNLKLLQEIEMEKPDLKLEIKRLIIKVKLSSVNYTLDFGGEHDIGMVNFFATFFHFIDSVFRLAFSVNFGDILVLVRAAQDIPNYLNQITQAGYPPIQDDSILHFGRIMTHLLIKDPTLLTLASEIEVARGRYQLLQSLSKIQKFIDHVSNKNQNSQKTIFFYDTEKESIKMRYKFNQQNKEVELMKKSDFEIFGQKIKLIQNNIENGGEPVSLSQDIFFVASVILVGFVKSGIVEPIIIDIAANQTDQKSAELIRQFLSSDFFQPSIIHSFLAEVFGDVFYLDLGKAFSNLIERKTEYRKWLPAWTTFYPVDKPNVLDNFKNNFVLEWDCGDGYKNAKLYDDSIIQFKREVFGLSCTQPVPQQDPPHFPSSLTYSITWSISEQNILPADEVFFSFPYILFQDPSFGELVIINKAGILAISGENSLKISNYLNSCGVQEGKKAYFDLPRSGNCALNAALQNIISGLISKIRR
jgi:hypothetical protein